MDRILVVEDDDALRDALSAVLSNEGFDIRVCSSAEEAVAGLSSAGLSCILSDFKLPKRTGLDLLRDVRSILPSLPFVMMTAYGSIDIAVQAMKEGANDFITKPFEPQALSGMLRQVITHKRIVERGGTTRVKRERLLLTESPTLDKILKQAKQVARVDSSVLILGESGTGKEVLARYIHENSSRSAGEFVAVNCAAIPDELLESELFGHEAGAFTGATQSRIGMFEFANTGTILLDEIGDMPLHLQVKLLRTLQEREIRRVGSSKPISVNPRVIASTNKKLEELLAGGILREDLYYRLAVIIFTLPPLRERKPDILKLAKHFTELATSMAGKEVELSEEALEFLTHYNWPGNVRELENVIERAVILSDNSIQPEHLGISVPLNITSLEEASLTLTEVAARAAAKAERELIDKVLKQTGGNKSHAARILGVTYKTLLNKAREYGLDHKESHSEEHPSE